jgi:TPR repeat protein
MARFQMDLIDAMAAPAIEMSAEAYYEMGLAHACGRSRPVDLVEAHKWFNVALIKGCREAAERRAELAGEMSADEIAAALREARAFITKH